MASKPNDPVWDRIRREASEHASEEPILASFLHATILNHLRLEMALSFHLANRKLQLNARRCGDVANLGAIQEMEKTSLKPLSLWT